MTSKVIEEYSTENGSWRYGLEVDGAFCGFSGVGVPLVPMPGMTAEDLLKMAEFESADSIKLAGGESRD